MPFESKSKLILKSFNKMSSSLISTTESQAIRDKFSNSVSKFADRSTPEGQSPPSKELSQKVQAMQRNLKRLEREYRKNLKVGFENKIKAYRLQAVLERKALKNTIEETKETLKNEDEKVKIKKAMQQRAVEIEHKNQLIEKKAKRLGEIQRKKQEEKEDMERIAFQQMHQIEIKNRELLQHKQEEEVFKNQKKKYFELYRIREQKRDQIEMKKTYLHSIMSKTEKLRALKDELSHLTPLPDKKSDTFITI